MVLYVAIPDLSVVVYMYEWKWLYFFLHHLQPCYNENHGSWTKWKNYTFVMLSSTKYIQVSVNSDETVEFIDYDGKILCQVTGP